MSRSPLNLNIPSERAIQALGIAKSTLGIPLSILFLWDTHFFLIHIQGDHCNCVDQGRKEYFLTITSTSIKEP